MQIRKEPLLNDYYYHIYSRSIAGYKIFNDFHDFERFCTLLSLCRFANFEHKLSQYLNLDPGSQLEILTSLKQENNVLVEIIAYCLMPTHIHLLVKQVANDGISKFMSRVLNAYSKYFNTRHGRSGHLWSDRFKSVLVQNDEQLLHLTRYIHLNPSSAGLVDNPAEWNYSSYKNYIDQDDKTDFLTDRNDLFDINCDQYKKFVLDRKSYQHELSLIKSFIFENYSG